MSRKRRGVSTFAGLVAWGLWFWVPAASGDVPSPAENVAEYAPLQSISYSFGSKFMSGYFVELSDLCSVTLMVFEKSDPEEPLALSPTRIRFGLNPGQIVGLDSEEGDSLNLTCGADAMTMLVEVGERAVLVAR